MDKSIIEIEEIFQKGLNYYYGINDTKQDIRKSFGYFLQAKEDEHEEADYYLGLLYMYHEPYVQKNLNKAFECFKALSSRGLVIGHFLLGECYMFGYGTNIDYNKAIIEYEKAREQFYVPAIDRLCDIYRNGIGVEVNLSRAFDYNEQCKILSNDYESISRFKIRSIGIKISSSGRKSISPCESTR